MNTRRTIRNESELKMNNDSNEERDRERNEERQKERDDERNRERDEERDRERDADRDRERDAMSCRVTGTESQVRPRGVGSSKRTLQDGAFGGTPPKRQNPATVSSHTYTATGARPKEPVVQYCGTEQSDTGTGASTIQYQTSDRGHGSQERRRLF